MAGGMDLGTGFGRGSRRKPLDAPLNLVPLIDLMAVTLSFLLMTAVWTQTGRLQVAQSGGGDAEKENVQRPEWTVVLTTAGIRLDVSGAREGAAVMAERFSGDRAKAAVTSFGVRLADRIRAQDGSAPQVIVVVDDDVPYELVVGAVDACIGAGARDVTVQTG